jgi:hypothetical protein
VLHRVPVLHARGVEAEAVVVLQPWSTSPAYRADSQPGAGGLPRSQSKSPKVSRLVMPAARSSVWIGTMFISPVSSRTTGGHSPGG